MEADWSVELAADDPAIVVPWRAPWSAPDESDPFRCQFINLRHDLAAINQIEEACSEPALRSALLMLNGARSRLVTVKCGLWKSSSQLTGPAGTDAPIDSTIVTEVDPWEMDAEPADAMFAAGCYIDIVPLDSEAGGSFAIMENWLRGLTKRLREVAMRCARADFVLRRSEVYGAQGFAVTWFIEACGATAELSRLRRAEALTLILPVVMEVAPTKRWFPPV